MSASQNQDYMLQALAAAGLGRGFCAPNPAVGAVIVNNGQVIATGFHQGVGHAHAEAMALAEINNAEGATLYVTLEPCNHWGRTPPCTEAIINKKIAKVYYGYSDPNPTVAGKGAEYLRAHGIECELLSLPIVDEFYRSYQRWLATGRPWVTAKLALSLDGKIAGPNKSPAKITGDELQQLTHRWRKKSDAILTTQTTVQIDDPALNIRLDQKTIAKPIYLLDTYAQLACDAKILSTAANIILFHSSEANRKRLEKLQKQGVRCIEVELKDNLLNLEAILDLIGKDGVHDLWVEAGGICFESFYEQNLINRILFYLSPITLGAESYSAFQHAHQFEKNAKQISWKVYQRDQLVWEIEY